MLRIPFDKMQAEFARVLRKKGFSTERADLCARLFAEASLDGVYSHGLNRFPRFIDYIEQGDVDSQAEPSLVASYGALERWDGHRGPGNLNAYFCMNRALALARQHLIGCVALAHTNHWMRAGTYGLQAAAADCIGICWTNTMPNMPPWGGKEPKLGNNPIVFAIPRADGKHLLLDMAVSVFSYGKIETYARRHDELPVDGGFDQYGNLTNDPKVINETKLSLPVGYWKGSGLALVLDLIAMILSGGNSTYQIGQHGTEKDLSQVFLAIDYNRFPDREALVDSINQTISDLQNTVPFKAGHSITYPGENMLQRRAENLKLGIPVDETYWQQVLAL